mgnify:CR=1 FL=1
MTSTKFETKPLFTRRQLTALLLPLIAEQALSVTIGLADTLMVSSVGEAAVSGVSLVDTFNTLMIQIMTALATGGAVVTSQYIGHREEKSARLPPRRSCSSCPASAFLWQRWSWWDATPSCGAFSAPSTPM